MPPPWRTGSGGAMGMVAATSQGTTTTTGRTPRRRATARGWWRRGAASRVRTRSNGRRATGNFSAHRRLYLYLFRPRGGGRHT